MYGLGSVRFWSWVRARGGNFLFFSHRLYTIPFKQKTDCPKSGARADPKSGSGLRFFFERPQSLGSLNSGPRRGMPLLSTCGELSSAALSSLESSFGLI